jgi:hypothetical protein
MNDERRYSEAELHAIFERTAKRQEEAHRAEMASRGQLTLAELQEIGAASGIDPAHVAAAAAELNTAPPKDVHTFLGAPTEIERTRFIPYDVSDDEWARIVAEVRRTFDDDGSIGQIGQMREWTAIRRTSNNTGSVMRLTLEPTGDGSTRATLRQSVRETTKGAKIASAVMASMALLFTVLGFVAAEPEMWIAVAAVAVVGLAITGGARGWLGYWGARQEEKFDGVLDRVELIARDPAEAAPAPAEATIRPEPRLDLDALPDEADGTSTSERRRTKS